MSAPLGISKTSDDVIPARRFSTAEGLVKQESTLISRNSNLDSRVRGNDER